MRISDWSSDVCSSDLETEGRARQCPVDARRRAHIRTRTAAAAISARTVRRDAAAGDDRDGAALQALAADRRRADDGARRDGPGHDHPAVRQAEARSEEHTSELQSLMRISYAVFCLKKKKTTNKDRTHSATHEDIRAT